MIREFGTFSTAISVPGPSRQGLAARGIARSGASRILCSSGPTLGGRGPAYGARAAWRVRRRT
jgi:hypothetical protein